MNWYYKKILLTLVYNLNASFPEKNLHHCQCELGDVEIYHHSWLELEMRTPVSTAGHLVNMK